MGDLGEGSLVFGRGRGSAPDMSELLATAGVGPPRRTGAGSAFAHTAATLPPARPPPPKRSAPPRETLPEKKNESGRATPRAPGGTSADPELRAAILAMVQSQQALLQGLAANSGDPLRSLTRDGGFGDDNVLKLPGAKGAAALEIYRQDLAANPEDWSRRVRLNAARAVSESVDPGVSNSMMDFLLRYMPWGKRVAASRIWVS